MVVFKFQSVLNSQVVFRHVFPAVFFPRLFFPLVILTIVIFCVDEKIVLAESSVMATSLQVPAGVATAGSFGSFISQFDDMSLVPTEKEEQCNFQVELGSLQLQDGSGTKYYPDTQRYRKTVVYFWSIYCRSCVETLTDFRKLKDDFAANGIDFITVHLFEPSIERVLIRLAEENLSFPVFFIPQPIRELLSVRTLPTSLVFDSADSSLSARFDGMSGSDGLRLELFGKLSK